MVHEEKINYASSLYIYAEKKAGSKNVAQKKRQMSHSLVRVWGENKAEEERKKTYREQLD